MRTNAEHGGIKVNHEKKLL